jgi:6-phosphofructokinase
MRNKEIAALNDSLTKIPIKNLRIGIVNLGKPCPGLNNVIYGLLKFADSYGFAEVIGFVGGINGLVSGNHITITHDNFKNYKNQGGGDFLGCSNRYL